MPKVTGKVILPLCQRSDQPYGQNANRIRVYNYYGTRLSDFGAESGIEAY